MTAVAVIAPFDYSTIDPDLAQRLRNAAHEMRRSLKGLHHHIFRIGRGLVAIKETLPHGKFGAWLEAEFGMSERAAQNYMRAFEVLGEKSATVAELQPTTVYLLAAPSTPPTIKNEVIQRLEAGEALGDKAIKEMVAEAKAAEKERAQAERKAAELAKLSPSGRRSRERREEERRRENEAMKREQAERKAAAAQAVAFLAERLGEGIAEFRRLYEAAGWEFGQALRQAGAV